MVVVVGSFSVLDSPLYRFAGACRWFPCFGNQRLYQAEAQKPVRGYRETTQDLRKTAKGRGCTLRISGYRGCSGTDTTVLAHLPSPDDGKAIKSPDWFACFACMNCHDIIDGRNKNAALSSLDLEKAKSRALYETLKTWQEEGIIVF